MAIHSISLCSGVGGLDIGVSLALGGLRHLCYVEREISAARILARRMEDGALQSAPIWSDLSTFNGSRFRGVADIITAGFPCPDYSVAGKREGRFGKHGQVWDHVIRIIREVGPILVVLENVSGILIPHGADDEEWVLPAGLHFVLGDLAESGFDAEWLCLRASDVGAPHRRERWFCVAYNHGRRFGIGANQGEPESVRRRGARISAGGDIQLAHAARRGLGVCGESSGGRGLADGGDEAVEYATDDHGRRGVGREEAGVRQDGIGRRGSASAGATLAGPAVGLIPQPGRGPQGRDGAGSAGEDVPDASGEGLERRTSIGNDDESECQTTERDGRTLFPPGPGDTDAWREVIDRWPWLAPAAEPGLRGLVDGTPLVVDASRADQLRALGNGVVVLQAAVAVRELIERIEMRYENEAQGGAA